MFVTSGSDAQSSLPQHSWRFVARHATDKRGDVSWNYTARRAAYFTFRCPEFGGERLGIAVYSGRFD
jgi:hypothetical protein